MPAANRCCVRQSGITGTAILQCVEDGKIDLDARHHDAHADAHHTAGFGYDFFNANYLRMAQEHGQPSVVSCSRASLMTPLLFDPGDKWDYGSNIDWCGQIVERIHGKRLGEVMHERIFGPLG